MESNLNECDIHTLKLVTLSKPMDKSNLRNYPVIMDFFYFMVIIRIIDYLSLFSVCQIVGYARVIQSD